MFISLICLLHLQAMFNYEMDLRSYFTCLHVLELLLFIVAIITYGICLSYMLVLFRIRIFNLFKYEGSMSLISLNLQQGRPHARAPTQRRNGGAPPHLSLVVGGRLGCVRSRRRMGKDAGETQQPADGAGGGTGGSRGDRFCCWCGRGGGAARVIQLQCVAALVLGVTILLSVLFWLPPFTGRGGGKEGPDPSDEFGVTVLLSVLFWLPPFTGRGGGKEGPDPSDEFGGELLPPAWRDLGSIRLWSPSAGSMLDLRLLWARGWGRWLAVCAGEGNWAGASVEGGGGGTTLVYTIVLIDSID
jgi:hypothetical protein